MKKQMTTTEIRARLAEIEHQQAQHQARDFDAELLAVMKDGGDVDALESAQLEAERHARRLRVERQALEAALPEAIRTEARHEVEQIAAAAKKYSEAFARHADQLVELDLKRAEVFRQLEAAQDRLDSHRQAATAVVNAADMPSELKQELLGLMGAGGRPFDAVPEPTRSHIINHFITRSTLRQHGVPQGVKA